MRRLILALDRWQRRRLGIFALSDAPDNVFRVSLGTADRPIETGEGTVPADSPVLELHLWNEHVPRLPAEGPTLAWGARGVRRLVASCRRLAVALAEDPRLADVVAVGGTTVLVFSAGARDPARLIVRLGFTVAPFRHPWGRLGELAENLWTWLIMWAFNSATLRHHQLLGLARTECWMSRDEFIRRHGPGGGGDSGGDGGEHTGGNSGGGSRDSEGDGSGDADAGGGG